MALRESREVTLGILSNMGLYTSNYKKKQIIEHLVVFLFLNIVHNLRQDTFSGSNGDRYGFLHYR